MKVKEKQSKIKAIFIIFVIILVSVGVTIGGIKIYATIDSYKKQIENMKLQDDDVSEIDVIEKTLEKAQNLQTANYVCTIVVSDYNSKKVFGKNVPFTTTGYIISYRGKISAGLDLSKIKVKSGDADTIEVTLPKIQLDDVKLYKDSFQLYDEKNSIFNPLKIEEINEKELEVEKRIKEDAVKDGIEKKARENAENLIINMLEPLAKGKKIVIK